MIAYCIGRSQFHRAQLISAWILIIGLPAVQAIEPWSENPWYWSRAGQPVMLLGGSDDDNLFQWPKEQLVAQLDRIQAAGGNVVRNTMSDRKDAGFEVYPYLKLESGKYDLSQWNPDYWNRFAFFLQETAKRGIVVQIEVWDRFDYTDNRSSDPRRWENHPYNPPNNINYTAAETGLANRYPEHPGQNKQPFFFSTPDQRKILPLLKYQEAFVNRLLDDSLAFDHVLYCIDNETRAEPAWAEHWAKLIRQRAEQAGKSIAITEMWDDWDLTADRHRQTFDHPELYDFVDVSQNNHNSGQKHWDNFLYVRELLSGQPRPINTTKTYGADGNKFGHSDQDAVERFWRHLLGGAASVRFHRPESGLGINDKAMACIRAARLLETSVPFWELRPAKKLLGDREPNEAYAAATGNLSTIAIYFPARSEASEVSLRIDDRSPLWQTTWIDVDKGKRVGKEDLSGNKVSPPNSGNMVAVLRRKDQPMLPGELFELQDRSAFVFLPSKEKRSEPQPWVMYAPALLPNYPDEHERWLHEQILEAGIAIAGIDVGEAYGSPLGNEALTSLYRHLTETKSFDPKPCLLGRSRGGLWVSSWASEHPGQVSGLAGIYPVFDLTTYPGLPNSAQAYQLSPDELSRRLAELNPISKSRRLAELGLPMFLIHGVDDQVVPFEANSEAMRLKYEQAGQESAIDLKPIPGQGHNYWPGFFRDRDLIRFVIRSAKGH